MLDAPTTAVIMRIITDRAATGAAVLMASHDQALLKAIGGSIHELDLPADVGERSASAADTSTTDQPPANEARPTAVLRSGPVSPHRHGRRVCQ
jgi:hypothetical protein